MATPESAASHDGESGNVLIGYGTSGERRRRRARGAPAVSSPQAAGHVAASPGTGSSGAASASGASIGAASAGQSPPPGTRVAVVSPLVRRLAREAGLDVTVIQGSGRDGLITRYDVDLAIDARRGEAQPAAPGISPGPGPATVPDGGPAGLARIPIRGVRKAVADKLSRSRREIPEATVWVDVFRGVPAVWERAEGTR